MAELNKSPQDDEADRERSQLFKDELMKFNTIHGRENFKIPQIGGKELDLYSLFKEVIVRGGSHSVSESKHWKEIVNALELPASCTSASFTLRNHYNRCLLSYEQYYFNSQNAGKSNASANSTNNLATNTGANKTAINNLNNTTSVINNTGQQPNASLEQKFLGKKIMRNDTEFNLFFRYQSKPQNSQRDRTYNKKVRLLNSIPDTRRIVLAFESHTTSEIIWALNILILFSSNQNCTLLIENQPYLMESMTNYLYYCVNNISEFCFIIEILEGNLHFNSNNINNRENSRTQSKRSKSYNESTNFQFLDEINNTINLSTLTKKNKNLFELEQNKKENKVTSHYEEVTEFELMEHLISIIQIIRNLSFVRANESSIIKCSKFMNLMFLLFIYSNIHEIRFNCLDIITNLSKHIILKDTKYPLELLNTIFDCLKNFNREISEQALECFRRLTFPVGNEEFLEKMSEEFFEELVNKLIEYKMEIRESALEILYCLSDQKIPTKVKLGKQNKCIDRLVALLCSNLVDNRISKYAACTLANLSSVPSILNMILPFEQELILAATTDDSISKIILSILS